MDEEEELDNTLIGQEEEEAPAVNTEDALIGAGQVNFRDYDVPAPPRTDLPLFKLLTSVQVEPSQSSVSPICGAAGADGEPPKTTAFDAVPAPATYILTAFKSTLVLHEPADVTFGYRYLKSSLVLSYQS